MNTLFDKFLNDELSDSEADELMVFLQKEENGRELVEYISETQAIVSVGRKVAISTPLSQKPFKLIPVIMAVAAVLAVGLFMFFTARPELWIADTEGSFVLRGNVENSLSNGEFLKNGDVVRASRKTELIFKDNSRIILYSGTRIRIESAVDKKFFLEEGYIRVFTSVQQSSAGMVCETEDLKATAMGTEFSIYKMREATFVKVQESKVEVVMGTEVKILSEGMEAVADTGRLQSSDQKDYTFKRWEAWSRSFRQDPDIALYMYSAGESIETAEFRDSVFKGTLTAGRWPQNKAFRGHISYPSSTNFKSEELTFFTWFKLRQRGDHPPLITKGDDSWRLQTGGKGVYLDLSDGHLANDAPVTGTTPLKLDTWYLACGVFTKKRLKLYLNGELEGESVSQNRNYNNFPIVIGGNAELGRVFRGAVSEAGIVRRALTQQEIKFMFLSGKP